MFRFSCAGAVLSLLGGGCLQTSPVDTQGTSSSGDSVDPGTGQSTSTTDTSGSVGSVGPETSGAGPTQHPGCELPLPSRLPELPYIRVDGAGVPTFADWQGIDCDTALLDDVATCAEGASCGESTCLLGSPSAGVCSEIGVDSSCAGGLEAMGWAEHTCWGCVAPLVHAKACCTFADQGFDCRDWPFPSDGPFGSVCGRHQDCEDGLICGPHVGSDYGICQCPGLDSNTILPDPTCFAGA